MKHLACIVLLFIFLIGKSQSTEDVIRIMNENVSGSARTMALGGAQSVLGADLGGFQYNPASIGIFRSSQAGITFGVVRNKADITRNKELSEVSKSKSTINNMGIVFSTTDDDNEKLKSVSIGISYNRENNFQNYYEYEGFNDLNSITSYFGEQTTTRTKLDPNELNTKGFVNRDAIQNISQLVWISELINIPIGDTLFTGVAENGNIYQEYSVEESGYQNHVDITLGANFNDFFYFGGSLGIHYYEYESIGQMTEVDVDSLIPNFVGFTYKDKYQIQGTGTNLKLGVILRPMPWVRLGVSMETPTVYNIETNRQKILENVIVDDVLDASTRKNDFETLELIDEFTITTPFKYTFGMVLLGGKYGLLSADIERINYSNSKIQDVKNNNVLKNVTNVRVGIEGRYDVFRIRLGLAVNGTAYDNVEDIESKKYYTFGLGYKSDVYFIDYSSVFTSSSYDRYPYELNTRPEPVLHIKQLVSTHTITLGTRF